MVEVDDDGGLNGRAPTGDCLKDDPKEDPKEMQRGPRKSDEEESRRGTKRLAGLVRKDAGGGGARRNN